MESMADLGIFIAGSPLYGAEGKIRVCSVGMEGNASDRLKREQMTFWWLRKGYPKIPPPYQRLAR